MNYSKIKYPDVANGEGIRVSLFVSGCRNHCKECFNPETWRFNFGETFTEETEAKIIKLLDQSFIQGLSLLGGDPFEPENAAALLPFVQKVKKLLPNKNVWCYTGYTYENIANRTNGNEKLLKYIDVLVDGPFVAAKKDLKLRFCGSRNQRLLVLENGQIVRELDKYIDDSVPPSVGCAKCKCNS